MRSRTHPTGLSKITEKGEIVKPTGCLSGFSASLHLYVRRLRITI